jgi:hypothetical protein
VTGAMRRRTGARHSDRPASLQPSSPALRSEFERLLSEDGCPACSYLAETERSFFAWFVNENHSSASVQAELRASMGMCAVHARRIIEDPGPGPVVTLVAREGLAGAISHVQEGTRPARCPACRAASRGLDGAGHLVIAALERERDASRYAQHRGLCLEHVLALSAIAGPTPMTTVAERLCEGLRNPDPLVALELLASVDPDASRRGVWRERLSEPSVETSTIARLCAHLEVAACPACLAAGLGEARYIDWLLERSRADDPSLRTDPGELCSAHLRDAALQDPAGARYAIDRKRTATMGALRRLLDRLARLPRPTGRRRQTDGETMTEHLRATVFAVHQCPACLARETAEHRQLELLNAALALPPVRDCYESNHGLCVHHALRLPAGASGQVARRVIGARIGVLAWEVGEIRRKYVWASRHEPTGPEQDGWLRGFVQIDGAVLGGGPAPFRAQGNAERSS